MATAAVTEIARQLRTGKPVVVARIEDAMLLLDPRTVMPSQDEALVSALSDALG